MEVAAFEEVAVYTETRIEHRTLGVTVFLTDQPTNTIREYPGLIIPFNLTLDKFPTVQTFLIKHPHCIKAANVMLRPPVAESTLTVYAPVVEQFRDYCNKNDFSYPYFTSSAVIGFMGVCYENKLNIHFFSKILPSLAALEGSLDRSGVGINLQVNKAMNSFKRELAKSKQPVRKANLFQISVFEPIIQKEILEHIDDLYKINATHFRSIFRAIIIYFTFCRFSDFRQLTDSNFEDLGDSILVTFPKSKNDQYYQGTTSVLPEKIGSKLCPVKITRLYFQRFKLNFKNAKVIPAAFVNFRIAKREGYHVRIPGKTLCATNATKCTRELLKKYNIDGDKFTEKSMKVSGVTALCDSGEPLENVSIMGRWRSLVMPMHYRNTSHEFKKSVANNIPLK